MKTRIHLISAPWSDQFIPSIQIGALKAHLDTCQIEGLEAKSYSAFLKIPYDVFKGSEFSDWEKIKIMEEYPYGLALLQNYCQKDLAKSKSSITQLASVVNKQYKKSGALKLSASIIRKLSSATEKYVDDNFLSDSKFDGIDVYGFTMNYSQVMSSLYMAKSIFKKSKNKNIIFLFGGMSASIPSVVELMQWMNLPSFGILGEGEAKIEKIARLCLSANSYEQVTSELTNIKGVYLASASPNLWIKDKTMYEGQYSDISELPIPNFEEYFDLVEELSADKEAHSYFLENIQIPIEGSRGCFAKCSFCGLNYMWIGFRKMSESKVVERLSAVSTRYQTYRLLFVDNVCDTWAEGYADNCIDKNLTMPSFMELRAHHPEKFWTKLSLAGVDHMQIGVEALSEGVLKLIGKGTTVAQNLLTMKYLEELGIESMSNLITMYPGSTPDHALETIDLLKKLPHFQIFSNIHFRMVLGSPLFEKLTIEERENLKRFRSVGFPEGLEKFIIELGYKTPERLLSAQARKAWLAMEKWYDRDIVKLKSRFNPKLTCQPLYNGFVRVNDSRIPKEINTLYIEPEEALVFQLCHAGPSLETIVRETKLPEDSVKSILSKFENLNLVHKSGLRYVNLCIRKRDELISNYLKEKVKPRSRPQTVENSLSLVRDDIALEG